jgi:hypothetical protein
VKVYLVELMWSQHEPLDFVGIYDSWHIAQAVKDEVMYRNSAAVLIRAVELNETDSYWLGDKEEE